MSAAKVFLRLLSRRLVIVVGGGWRFIDDVDVTISGRMFGKTQVAVGQVVPFCAQLGITFHTCASTELGSPNSVSIRRCHWSAFAKDDS
jgi:hypothetical protein